MNKEQVNHMIFKVLFRQAVIDDFNENINSIPTNEQLAKIYSFSTDFEIRMKKLFTKERRKSSLKNTMLYIRKIASIFVIVLGLLFGALLLDTEVRAAVGKAFVEWYGKFTSLMFRNDEIISEKKDWTLNYLPEGYILKDYEVLGSFINIEFTNSQGEKIRFSYVPEETITNISVDNENHEIDKCMILKNEGFSIRAINDEFDNGIIWSMKGYTFDLWGKLPMVELKK